jgi:hypothetical protein
LKRLFYQIFNLISNVEALAIHDLAGRSVKTWNWAGKDTMNLEIQDLPAGSYLLFLKSKYASWSRKIVIQ